MPVIPGLVQGRGWEVKILQSEKQTEMWQKSWTFGLDRPDWGTFQALNLEMLEEPRRFIRIKKEDMVITY
jgi:hypothetical protein